MDLLLEHFRRGQPRSCLAAACVSIAPSGRNASRGFVPQSQYTLPASAIQTPPDSIIARGTLLSTVCGSRWYTEGADEGGRCWASSSAQQILDLSTTFALTCITLQCILLLSDLRPLGPSPLGGRGMGDVRTTFAGMPKRAECRGRTMPFLAPPSAGDMPREIKGSASAPAYGMLAALWGRHVVGHRTGCCRCAAS